MNAKVDGSQGVGAALKTKMWRYSKSDFAARALEMTQKVQMPSLLEAVGKLL